MPLLKKTEEGASVTALRKELETLKKEVAALRKELSKKPAGSKGADPRVDKLIEVLKRNSRRKKVMEEEYNL